MSVQLLRFSQVRSGVFSRVWQRMQADDCFDLAAQISYFFSLSLLPFCLVLAVIAGWLPSTALWQSFATWIITYLPRQSQHLIFATILGLEQNSTGFFSFGLATAIWSASSGFVSLMESLSVVYEGRGSRSYWRKHVIGAGVTVLAVGFAVATFGIMAFGHWGSGRFADRLSTWGLSRAAIEVARWGITFILMAFAVDLAYFVLPDGRRSWRWMTPGSIFAVLTLIASTAGLNVYITHFTAYPRIYGTLGGFIILMVWIYIISLILLVGAEADCVIENCSREAR